MTTLTNLQANSEKIPSRKVFAFFFLTFQSRKIPPKLILSGFETRRPKRYRAWFVIGLVGVMIMVLIAAQAQAENQNSIDAGQLLFADGTAAAHLESEVNFSITGMIATTSLKQVFVNDSLDWQEAVYVFPLPENGAVYAMEVMIGERVIRAKIQGKEEARQIYQLARNEGRRAALTEQQRPNVFTQSVANIGPGERVIVFLKYRQQVRYNQGQFSLRFPMTLTPRYIPGTPTHSSAGSSTDPDGLSISHQGWAVPTNLVKDAHQVTPPMQAQQDTSVMRNPITISLTLTPGFPLRQLASTYHEIDSQINGTEHHVSLRDGPVPMDRDFEFTWQPTTGREPLAAAFHESVSGEDYMLVMMLPPAEQHPDNRSPREVIFVLDTSGSMKGTSIVEAKRSLTSALDRLVPGDSFEIIEFNSRLSRLFQRLRPVDTQTLFEAKNWVNQLTADGGTEMLPALQEALLIPGTDDSNTLRQVIFITDGAVANEDELLGVIHQHLGNAHLFTVAIGSAPNTFFMSKAAAFGRGSFVHIGDISRVNRQMEALFKKLDSDTVSQLSIQWPTEVEMFPNRLPLLYDGEPLLVFVRGNNLAGELVVTGMNGPQPWHSTLDITRSHSSNGISTLWARRKIENLEDTIRKNGASEAIDGQIKQLGLDHSLITRLTSLVATEEYVARRPSEQTATVAIPNRVANGQKTHSLLYPKTATPAELLAWLGLLALLAGIGIEFVLVRR